MPKMIMTHEEDLEIRKAQARKVHGFISCFLQDKGISYHCEYASNFDPRLGFILFTGDKVIKNVANELSEMAKKNNSCIRFYASNRTGELEWDQLILVAEWSPYYWMDEYSGFHKLYDLRRIDEIEKEFDICGVFRTDNLPTFGEYPGTKSLYETPNDDEIESVIWRDAKFYVGPDCVFIDNAEGRIVIFCDGVQIGYHEGGYDLFEDLKPTATNAKRAARVLGIFEQVARENEWAKEADKINQIIGCMEMRAGI